ncbi:gluconate 2-dehydrogenase subunit 3 family protein [Halogeometricum sp. S1BR25-6]|uniref:Gluconate 2-dehydrogenase subunit 3 family protein n=1 Tax=Halogeometricum salsisoli TaxID=2950536 RepID=A0ABU2GER1_9EURY|nr:gluconate 2-dehydrogenase subunit 3 family protein [Halogeometricum sp. S1BR25-6]MDS0298941.1 gluconate 2-dehydrogenase subunit 3 family protein [Halogeometricum sp. S1BR25-6]
MELTRRDALAALAAGGAGSLAGCAAPRASDDGTGEREGEAATVGDHEMETLVAVAEVVYPSTVDGVSEFVRTYTGGRVDGEDAYARGVAAAVESLDGYTEEFHGDRYAALPASTRREVLDYMSVDVVEPAPDGTAAQRVRYYVVNELLYAFYTSPTGAGLTGLENPPGHPGGTESYREGPNG